MAEVPFQIYEDQENRVPGVRGKREGLKVLGNSTSNPQQRTAFGLLNTNNQSLNLRVQPSRTAKQVIDCFYFHINLLSNNI